MSGYVLKVGHCENGNKRIYANEDSNLDCIKGAIKQLYVINKIVGLYGINFEGNHL